MQPLAKGVWLISQPSFQVQPSGNVTVIEQSDGLVIVDSGGSRGAALRIIGLIRKISSKPVKAIILTHWHGDHVQGLSEFLRAWPAARTISVESTQNHLRAPATTNSPAAPDALRNKAMLAQIDGLSDYVTDMVGRSVMPAERCGWGATLRLLKQYRQDMDGTLTVPTQEGFKDRIDLPDPLRPVTAMFLSRANTDGDAVVWLPEQRIVATGDIVVAPFPYGANSYPADWLDALRKLRALRFHILIPGHGPVQRDQVYLDKLTAALTEVRQRVRAAHPDNGPDASARLDISLSEQTAVFVGEDEWQRRWFREFWEKPILDAAVRESRGEPIIQQLGSSR